MSATDSTGIDISNVRRVVTGHDVEGRSTAFLDAPCPHLRELAEFPTFRFTDLWVAKSSPATNRGNVDEASGEVDHLPSAGGNILRILEVSPDPPGVDMHEAGMHATDTLDYVYVLSGTITCILETGEVDLSRGDVLVQRGTVHAWSNRSNQPCVMLGVLVDATRAAT